MTLSVFTLKICDVQSPSHHKSTKSSSSKFQVPVIFSFHTQNPSFASLSFVSTNWENGSIHNWPHWTNAKILLTSVQRSFTLKCIFFFLFLTHRSGAKWLRVKIMHAFHVKEPELTWCKPHSILTVMTTGENIPLELHTTATFSFSSASVII